MNIRWMWGNYIEPEWKLTRAEVRSVHRLVKERYMRPSVLFGFTALWVVIAFSAVQMLRHFNVWAWPLVWYLTIMVVTTAVIIVCGLWSFRMIYTRPVRRAMRDLGYDVCVHCGYWLRGLDEDVKRCPECGSGRE